MAKRFADTGLINKEWYQALSLEMKVVWRHLCDACDCAGVWDINMPLLQFQTGAKVSLSEIKSTLGDRVEVHGDKLLLTGFIKFQYGELNPANNAHRGVLRRLERIKSKPLQSPLEAPHKPHNYGAQDKDKEKDKEKETKSTIRAKLTNAAAFLISEWNQKCGTKLQPINPVSPDPELCRECVGAYNATPKNQTPAAYWPAIFESVMANDFLRGDAKGTFRASLSWTLRNHHKIFRGDFPATETSGIDWEKLEKEFG